MRQSITLLLLLACLSACANGVNGPPGQPSSTNVNPIAGNRGGSGAR